MSNFSWKTTNTSRFQQSILNFPFLKEFVTYDILLTRTLLVRAETSVGNNLIQSSTRLFPFLMIRSLQKQTTEILYR
ncbi:hypothetical protein CLOSTMETH_02619 [[Clostridium] methylpentosum DSM 5476]|uniref:Uncharacterized protein n=1 Tax=[Clostridium] methylpentosum DSM 5476 TaxID=537013 RepID=C0EFH7_9FIRM|nr:hypothetical protein CLOSTMETH_02619 [[Clostridium] methylpentosum DSM 5476]